jgi:thiamine pyrophosphate-dependent acetolactate synthase large subunit-like protein
VLDNSALGKITKEQRAAELEVWQTSLVNPDFAQYAQLCGGTGIRVERAEQLDDALARAFATDGPVLVHVMADAELV